MFIENYTHLLPIATGVASFLMGLIILIRGWRQSQARVFAVFTFILSMWLLSTAFMMSFCSNSDLAVLIDRTIYIFVSAIPAVLFHFISIYGDFSRRKQWVILGYMIMGLFWLFVWSPSFIHGLYYFSNGCHGKAGILHHFFLGYFAIYSCVVVRDSYVLYAKELLLEKKRQFQFIFFSLLVEGVVAVIGFLPAYNIDSYVFSNSIGFFATLLLIYAMLRHDLFELKVVAINIFIGLVVAASLVQIFIAETPFLRLINALVFVVIVFLGFLVTKNVREEIQSREKGERLARYLANANARLRELDKQKTDFVSIASHQLRSPIAAIKGYASLLTDGTYGAVPETLQEPVNRILESGQRISIMVDDFLNITRIEQGRMTYNMVPQDVSKIVATVIGELRVVAEKKGLLLDMVCDSKKSYMVKVDEGKMKQIFSNLIDNSIKYTPSGSIQVSITTLEREHKVLIKIKDTGIGIATEEIQNLFQKFNRASNANEANVIGTGLGLYIAREIMKAHQGWINVESDGIGKGSTFTVELPMSDEVSEELKK